MGKNRNYRQYNKPVNEIVNSTNSEMEEVSNKIENDVTSYEIDSKDNEVWGTVTGCVKLNVREEPNKNSNIITTLNANDLVLVSVDKSVEGWYYIMLEDMIGFCMSDYVLISK